MRQKTRKLIEEFRKGNIKALSRLITYIENWIEAEEILSEFYSNIGKAHRVGFTGPPGAGKSTLLNRVALEMKQRGMNPSILAVDPTSPFSGGALLGDRFRMMDASNSGVFIRSMASRGSLGGIARTTIFVADLMDACGFDPILIETVGVGQIELDIMRASDTVVVVLVPESGDGIQAMKAGLMEIGDIFVVNKGDRPGADRFVMDVEMTLQLGESLKDRDWRPPVIKASALKNEGISEIVDAIERHRQYLKEKGKFDENRVRRYREEIEELVKQKLWEKFIRSLNLEEEIEKAYREGKSPYVVVKEVMGDKQSI